MKTALTAALIMRLEETSDSRVKSCWKNQLIAGIENHDDPVMPDEAGQGALALDDL